MPDLSTMTDHELRDLRAAARDAIEAIAWYDLQVADVRGVKQAEAQFSAIADGIKKIEAERKRRERGKRS